MKIVLPGLAQQRKVVFEEGTKEAIEALRENLSAQEIDLPLDVEESDYSNRHLLRESEGWEPPDPEIVKAYFKQFQQAFPEFDTDRKLSNLLGLSSNRRIREFKSGEYKVPYGIWRRFLVLTGRASQEIIPVMGFFK